MESTAEQTLSPGFLDRLRPPAVEATSRPTPASGNPGEQRCVTTTRMTLWSRCLGLSKVRTVPMSAKPRSSRLIKLLTMFEIIVDLAAIVALAAIIPEALPSR
jgi:hypothetical protein